MNSEPNSRSKVSEQSAVGGFYVSFIQVGQLEQIVTIKVSFLFFRLRIKLEKNPVWNTEIRKVTLSNESYTEAEKRGIHSYFWV